LPGYAQREFDDYRKCGRLAHGFMRVRCDSCRAEHLVAFSWLFLHGVYFEGRGALLGFRRTRAPPSAELFQRTQTLAHRIGRYLERRGLLERDADNACLISNEAEADTMEQLLGSSITYCIAAGAHQGRKVFTLQTLPDGKEPLHDGVG